MADKLQPTLLDDVSDESGVEYNLDVLEDNPDESDLLNYKDKTHDESARDDSDAHFCDEEKIDPNNYKGIYFGEEIDEK